MIEKRLIRIGEFGLKSISDSQTSMDTKFKLISSKWLEYLIPIQLTNRFKACNWRNETTPKFYF